MLSRFISGLYRALTVAAIPFLLLYVLWRGLRDRRYFRRVAERFGMLPPSFQRTAPGSVWLHAVSVGEVLSCIELIRRLRSAIPGASIFVSCSTLAGRETAEARLAEIADGVFYAPFDLVFAIRRTLRRIRPAAVVILETEIWPNLYREVKRSGCALVVVNGRISDRARESYRRNAWFFQNFLRLPDAILAQSDQDVQRYIEAGAPASRVHCAGNLKYDFQPAQHSAPAVVRDWLDRGAGPLWVAASTVAPEFPGDTDEDDAVIATWIALAGVRLLIAPRKPERFEVVAAKLDSAGVAYARRSELPRNGDAPVLLLDSLGELGAVFPFADVVFMGGTLAHRGGHNILEPALAARAVVTGPHLENFTAIQQRFRDGRGFVEIVATEQLTLAVRHLLENESLRAAVGARARLLAESERGATIRAAETVAEARWQATPGNPAPLALRALSQIWIAGGRVKRAITRSGRLSKPVVSVGGIAMGGSGKTPVVRALARALREEGLQPAVLTRGYRRKAPEPVTVLRAGETAPASRTGDEAQLILRDGHAHLGIGTDRYLAGLSVEERLTPDVYLLDDGFQHARLQRDLDIVVLDGLDPFAGGHVFPAGRLREPLDALERADIIVISRSEDSRFDGTVARIREHNSRADILFARTRLASPLNLPDAEPVIAFCGIGNPEAFRRTLTGAGVIPAAFRIFPDHHAYTDQDLKSLAAEASDRGARYLVTTDKDAMNIGVEVPPEVHLVSIRIETTVEGLAERVLHLVKPASGVR